MAAKRTMADVQIYKKGPNGRPAAEVFVDASASLDKVTGALQKTLTRNTDLLKKLGLKACPACISGLDIWIRRRFDEVITVDLEQVGR